MSLIQFSRKISPTEARHLIGGFDALLLLVKEVTGHLEKDGKLSGRDALEIVGNVMMHYGVRRIGDGVIGDEVGVPRRRHDDEVSPDSVDVRHPLHFDEGSRPEEIKSSLTAMESLVSGGVCLEDDGKPGCRLSRQPSDELLS
ncbi:MAG: hypothetical protein ABW161_01145 [Candidatus Thiodiazotropha sp.]